MGITRAEAPVWASRVLVEKAVLDRLLATLGTIPLDWGECGFIINFYFVYMAFMMVWLGVVNLHDQVWLGVNGDSGDIMFRYGPRVWLSV